MSVINTNISSLTAQRNLGMSQASLATSMQRLSSGLRINSAKDDAAGLAISERMTSQIRGSNQAARNANDGISLAQTAEGDLGQISNNLQRIRELAVQSANGTNTASDRSALNQESSALQAEIQRVASSSAFNGVKLLNGSFSGQDFQVGSNNTANDRINIASIANAQTATLGQGKISTTTFGGGTTPVSGGDSAGIQINGISLTAGATSAKDIAAKINNEITGVTASATNTLTSTTAQSTTAATAGAASLVINGVTISFNVTTTAGSNIVGAKAAITSAIDAANAAGTGGANAALMGLSLASSDATHINISSATGGDISTGALAGVVATDIGLTASVATQRGTITLTSQTAPAISSGGATILGGTASSTVPALVANSSVGSIDLSTVANAKLAIDTVDRALTEVNDSRASLGAIQNRFTSVVTSLQTTSENLSASRSRIQDADFAAETANLSRAQVLQQAGTAMVAQANQLPQGVLALLR